MYNVLLLLSIHSDDHCDDYTHHILYNDRLLLTIHNDGLCDEYTHHILYSALLLMASQFYIYHNNPSLAAYQLEDMKKKKRMNPYPANIFLC